MQHFITALEKAGELKRITAEVDPYLEITQITDLVSKEYGPALLFENVKGSEHPLLINAYGTFERMQMALHCDSLDDIAARIEKLIKMQPPKTLGE